MAVQAQRNSISNKAFENMLYIMDRYVKNPVTGDVRTVGEWIDLLMHKKTLDDEDFNAKEALDKAGMYIKFALISCPGPIYIENFKYQDYCLHLKFTSKGFQNCFKNMPYEGNYLTALPSANYTGKREIKIPITTLDLLRRML